MRLISRFRWLLILAVLVSSLSINKPTTNLAAPPPPGKPDLRSMAKSAEEAISTAISSHPERSLGFVIFDTQVEDVRISQDGEWAIGFLVAHDPESGEVAPTEPGLAITRQTEAGWEVYLPGDEAWQAALPTLSAELIEPGVREQMLIMDQIQETTAPTTPLSGYRLPWEAGKTTYVSQTVAHDRYTPSGNAHYSFDFYIPQTMFNLYAAKAGTVWSYRDDVPNGEESAGNYIVLEDRTTIPTTYQLYLHLAQNSIPPDLKVIGAPVQRGQYLGVADDTGVSTGHHLHYQVQTMASGAVYWGKSVDIVFEEVTINGGRPRVAVDLPYCTWPGDVCNEFQNAYVSANTISGDHTPPVGDFNDLATGMIHTSQYLSLSGWAVDTESELYSIQIIGNYDGLWREISSNLSFSPFQTTLDLCGLNIPDGPLSLALRLRDSSGNISLDLPGLRHILKNYPCSTPPPACSPGNNQVAIYSDIAFAGECKVLDIGEFPNHSALGAVGEKNIESIQLGYNVFATVYSDEDFQDRNETIASSDRNLSDNRIGNDQISSLRVVARNSAPAIPQPVWPPSGATSYTADRNIMLTWQDQVGGTQYRVRLSNIKGDVVRESGWLIEPYWQINSLAAGDYSWQVQAGNPFGESSWSGEFQLSIQSSTLPAPITKTAPYSNDIEGDAADDWRHSNYWDTEYVSGNPNGGQISWIYDVDYPASYDSGSPNSGELTSPRIAIPSSGRNFLRFWYRYATESMGIHWDQRWVQISTGGEFTNIFQLSDDQPNRWLQSPAIPLDVYAGQTIQVRFYFATLDEQLNEFQGWTIDNFSITSAEPDSCADMDGTMIAYGSSLSSTLCPGGDIDTYQFQGQVGDRIGILAEASPATSPVDPVLYLLDQDGKSILAENDDIIYAEQTDSFISYQLPATGTYNIKLKDWAHPTAGGTEYTYRITLTRDADQPQASLLTPPSNSYLSPNSSIVDVQATDATSGIHKVDFYLHEGNWITGQWIHLGTDSESSDGWSWEIDTSEYFDQTNMAVFSIAQDWAGNRSYSAAWNLSLDRTAPQTQLAALANAISNTAIVLDWTAFDNLSGIDRFEIQARPDGQNWQTFATSIPGDRRRAVFIGESGKTYSFRMRGIDQVGNIETYPTNPEASTTISNSICEEPDIWETIQGSTNDNQAGTATMVSTTFAEQIHNLCNPLTPGYLGDEDWLRIEIQADTHLVANAIPQHPGTAIVLELYAADGVTLLAQSNPKDFGESTILLWHAEESQRLYLRMRHLYEGVAGEGIKYTIQVTQGEATFFPILRK